MLLTLTQSELAAVKAAADNWQISPEAAAARLLARGLSMLAGARAGGLATGGRADSQARARKAAAARWARRRECSRTDGFECPCDAFERQRCQYAVPRTARSKIGPSV